MLIIAAFYEAAVSGLDNGPYIKKVLKKLGTYLI